MKLVSLKRVSILHIIIYIIPNIYSTPLSISILILTHISNFPLIDIHPAPKYPLALDQTPFPTGLPSPAVVVHPVINSVFWDGYQANFNRRNWTCFRSPTSLTPYCYQDTLEKIEAQSRSNVLYYLRVLSFPLQSYQFSNAFVVSVCLRAYTS